MHARISYLYILSYAYLFLVFHPLSHPVCGRNRFPGHKRSIVKDRHIGQSQLRYHLFDLILRQIFSSLFFHHVKAVYLFIPLLRIWNRMMNEPFRKQNIAVPEHSFYLFLILFLRPAPCTTQMIFLIQLTLPSKSPDPVLLSVIADRKFDPSIFSCTTI